MLAFSPTANRPQHYPLRFRSQGAEQAASQGLAEATSGRQGPEGPPGPQLPAPRRTAPTGKAFPRFLRAENASVGHAAGAPSRGGCRKVRPNGAPEARAGITPQPPAAARLPRSASEHFKRDRDPRRAPRLGSRPPPDRRRERTAPAPAPLPPPERSPPRSTNRSVCLSELKSPKAARVP